MLAPLRAATTIPVPRPDLDSLTKTVTSLKQAVEKLMAGPSMFIQVDQPQTFKNGDLWLQSGIQSTLSVAFDDKWYVVGTLS